MDCSSKIAKEGKLAKKGNFKSNKNKDRWAIVLGGIFVSPTIPGGLNANPYPKQPNIGMG